MCAEFLTEYGIGNMLWDIFIGVAVTVFFWRLDRRREKKQYFAEVYKYVKRMRGKIDYIEAVWKCREEIDVFKEPKKIVSTHNHSILAEKLNEEKREFNQAQGIPWEAVELIYSFRELYYAAPDSLKARRLDKLIWKKEANFLKDYREYQEQLENIMSDFSKTKNLEEGIKTMYSDLTKIKKDYCGFIEKYKKGGLLKKRLDRGCV